MNYKLLLILFCFFILNSFHVSSCTAQDEDSTNYPLVPIDAISDALLGIKMTPDDISFRTDYVEVDPFRLEIIDSLTKNPLKMPKIIETLTNFLLTADSHLYNSVLYVHACLTTDILFSEDTDKYILNLQFIDPDETLVPKINYPDFMSHADIVSLDPLIAKCFDYLLFIQMHNHDLLSKLSGEEIAFLRDSFPELLLEDIQDEFKPMEVLDNLQKYEEDISKRALVVCGKLDLKMLYFNDLASLKGVDKYFHDLISLSEDIKPIMDSSDWVIERETPQGKIAIGGWGENLYQGEYYFILDLGGDDLYQLDKKEGTQVIVDLDGNDTYIANDDYCLGSGNFGTGILYDLAGDDLYKAKNFSLGSGLFGVGFLIDESGNDTYIGDTHTQGAGTFGIGMLIDKGGNDNYNCALFGQAFAGPDGFGSIVDFNGNDNYFAGGKYKDFLRYEDHFLSLSQGFSFGFRPRMSGGVAILIDSSGNDIYTSDIFGQAASYWYGLGAMYDISGNDKYLSFQYAQGNGTHLSLGILMDKSGDDYYYAKGVSQGCGHDLAAGILIDYGGNDTYQAFDLSQAAGSANGVGILIDFLGNDTYEVKSTEKTQGYGNPRRDYGSIGLFMDLMGDDHYIGNGQNDYYWIIKSRWGIGMDVDFWEVKK